jgi:hypothetical protein
MINIDLRKLIQGTARALIDSATTISQIRNNIQENFKGPQPKTIKSKLEALRKRDKTNQSFVKEVEELSNQLMSSSYIGAGYNMNQATELTVGVVKDTLENNVGDAL